MSIGDAKLPSIVGSRKIVQPELVWNTNYNLKLNTKWQEILQNNSRGGGSRFIH